jgi:hypothetical protein
MFKPSLAPLLLCLALAAPACSDSSGRVANTGTGPESLSPEGGTVIDPSGELAAPDTEAKAPGKPEAPPQPVPEPMSMLLLGSGLAGMAAYRYRRRRRPSAADSDGAV